MVEPVIHFVIPFALLSFASVRGRIAFFASLLALLPDTDALFYVHRSQSHSLLLVSLAGVLLYVAFAHTPWRRGVLASVLALVSHPVLDVFSGFTPLFWPVSDSSFFVDVELISHFGQSLYFSARAGILTMPSSFTTFQTLDAPIFTSEGLAVSLMLFIPFLFLRLRKEA